MFSFQHDKSTTVILMAAKNSHEMYSNLFKQFPIGWHLCSVFSFYHYAIINMSVYIIFVNVEGNNYAG